MSTNKIYTSQQFEESQSVTQCPRCHQQEEMYIQLECGHKFCIVCITFSYLKYKNLLSHEYKLRCLQCQKTSELDSDLDQLIKEIISKQLGPIVRNESEGNTVGNNDSRISVQQIFTGKYTGIKENIDGYHHIQPKSYERNSANRLSTKNNINATNINSKPNTPNNHAHIVHAHHLNHYNVNNILRQHKHTFKSHEESIIDSQTPPKHPNRFYSKCETPKHLSSQKSDESIQQQVQSSRTDICPIHQNDQISYICVTCQFKSLCYKCIKSNKHYNHEVKIIKKAIEIINEKLSLLNLQTVEKIQNLQLYQKRLYDRKLIYEQRVEKNIKEIRQIFHSLEKKIVNKANEIIESYQDLCSAKIEEIQNKVLQNSEMLEKIKHFQSQVSSFLTQSESIPSTKSFTFKPSKLIQQFQEIKLTQSNLFPKNQLTSSIFKVHEQIIDPTNNYHNSELMKWVGKISEEIDYITMDNLSQYHEERKRFNETVPVASMLKDDALYGKNRTLILRQCSSRDKMGKNDQNFGKRIKTNIPISLNTSRDKRDKKNNTKTEEDQKRLKSKANYKTQANTLAKNSTNTATEKQSTKQIPSYITKGIEKHTQNSRKVSPFNHTTTMIQNSKNMSKIVGKGNVLNNHQEVNNRKRTKDTGSSEMIKDKKNMIKSVKNVEGVKRKK